MFSKNDIIDLEITGLTNEGCGVGKADGIVVFVPFSAVGDKLRCRIVKVNRSHCYGKIEEILTPSPDRITPDCIVFGKCGGCDFRHISYEAELRAKDMFIRDAFTRIGGITPEFLPIVPNCNENGYRNKAQYPVRKSDNGETQCGFFAGRSHRIIPCESCKLEPQIFGDIKRFILDTAKEYKISAYNEEEHNGVLRHICIRKGHYTNEICVTLVVRRIVPQLKPLASSLVKKFPDIKSITANLNKDKTNVIYGEESQVLFGKAAITDTMCEKSFSVSPTSFYQVNTPMAEVLYKKAAELAEPDGKTIIDLYCGAGTIGLTMADRARSIIGVEIVESAIVNAKENATLNNAGNARFICGDAGEATDILVSEGIRADVVIVDPARKGCDERTLSNIVKFSPEKIVMVSCNAVTAARDCAFLERNGYKCRTVQGVDLFSRTTHVEAVILLSKAYSE
ncbi:MAG: 23S rRNA (uracil(1939)-C(5))-methyltransferase RlmD [Ruminiclostridium sp.]|nr:23S rRNA (uracil(1939)-C(5))-methyltransferase RlmD [Ruminiclostridium sp.]